MLLANYASDSGSESETEPTPGPSRPQAVSVATTKTKKRGPVKIGLDLPKLSASEDGQSGKDATADEDEGRKSKKSKIEGKGSSALLGMLPPPKRKTPALANKAASLVVNKSMAIPPKPKAAVDIEDEEDEIPKGLLLPSSIARNKASSARSAEKDTAISTSIDLFGLSSTPEPSASTSSSRPITTPKPPTISSAPLVPDFIPPPPTSEDPYPGYYQLPNKSWQAYDPAYYHSFFPETQPESEAKKEDGRVGHHWDDYERFGGGEGMVEISASEGLEEARRERERQERMVKPKLPGEDFEYKAVGQIKGLAAERHQLSSLLHGAYSQREELEARIAQNKKNMRMAGQKYGF